MPTKTIKFYRPELIGESNLVMRLHLPGRSAIVNGSGTSASIDSDGLITASVTSTLTRTLYAVSIYDSVAVDFLWTPDGDSMVWIPGDVAGTYYAGAQALNEQALAEAKNLESPEVTTADTRAIEFDWLAGQTFVNSATTCLKFFPGQAVGTALSGAISLVRAGRYSLAFNLADRAADGVTVVPAPVQYNLVDDNRNYGYITLRILSDSVIPIPNSESFSIVITDDQNNPVAHCSCWVSTDIDGNNVVTDIWETDSFGKVEFVLGPGTYYLFRQKNGVDFTTNPRSFTIA